MSCSVVRPSWVKVAPVLGRAWPFSLGGKKKKRSSLGPKRRAEERPRNSTQHRTTCACVEHGWMRTASLEVAELEDTAR